MKTDRLLAETIYLLQRGRATSRQMAERFEVSRRTILRDMDALSLAGGIHPSRRWTAPGRGLSAGGELPGSTTARRTGRMWS